MSNQPVIAGFHCCNNNAPTGKDRDIIRMTEAGAITFLTGMGQRFSVDDVKWVLSINPKCHFFLREYLDPNRIGDRHDRSTWNYSVLYDYFFECKETIAKYLETIPNGQFHFQIFNEQNMPTWAQWEGFGDTPDDMKRFNQWFVAGMTILQPFAPTVKFGLTPLTPGNRDAWFETDREHVHYYLHGPQAANAYPSPTNMRDAIHSCLCKEAINIADEYYFHAYVHENHEPVDHPAYGLRFRKFLHFLPNKPFWILECGYPNEAMWKGDERLLDWFTVLDTLGPGDRPDGVTFWILGEKKDWGNMFAPGGVIRPFVYNLKQYLNEREGYDENASLPPTPLPPPEPEPEPTTEIEIHDQDHGYTTAEFIDYLSGWLPFAEINEVFVHHTVNPTPAYWRGRTSILAMKSYYERKGWTAGPHIFVAPDGIWVFTPVNKQGIGCVGHNDHAIHVEIVGNYDDNFLGGVMRRNAIDAFAAICEWLQYDPKDLCVHRDFSDTRCPGKNIGFWFKSQVLRTVLVHTVAEQIGVEPIRINEDAALYKYAREQEHGAPLTNELECCGRVAQGFATCILSAKEGLWTNIAYTPW